MRITLDEEQKENQRSFVVIICLSAELHSLGRNGLAFSRSFFINKYRKKQVVKQIGNSVHTTNTPGEKDFTLSLANLF